MIYKEELTMMTLSHLNIESLSKKIRSLTIDGGILLFNIRFFLEKIQAESKIMNKKDFNVTLEIQYKSAKKRTIKIKVDSDHNLMPHLCNTVRPFIFETSFDEFKLLTVDEMMDIAIKNSTFVSLFGDKPKSCSETTIKNINMLKKLDTLFECKGKLVNPILKNGFYMEKTTLILNNFIVGFDDNSVKITSKAKSPDGNKSMPSISVDLKELRQFEIDIKVYNHMLSLSYEQFMEAELKELTDLILLGLKLRNIEVATMEDFNNFLLVEEMKGI